MKHLTYLLPIVLTACAATPQTQSAASAAQPAAVKTELTEQQKFDAWKVDFKRRAIAKGYEPSLVSALIDFAELRESAVSSNENQPEFVKPVWDYVENAANARRLDTGKGMLSMHSALFDSIEAEYGVDRYTLTAIWGLESAYGDIQGNYSPASALASLAYDGRRQKFAEAELFALLDLLQSDQVREDQLRSSWAGAMGMMQFIPSTYRDYAVDYDRNGNTNLWDSPDDALASAANYLARYKWERGMPPMAEVRLPEGFDYSLADGRKMFIQNWEGLGVTPYQGGQFAPGVRMKEAKLYLPAGHRGPALLTFKNFDVIKRYNNSSSYAMGISVLAGGLNNQQIISHPWPEGDRQISNKHKDKLQAALTSLGFDTQGVDGMIGPNSRKAIRAWQVSKGLPADAYVPYDLYLRIVSEAGMEP